MEILKLKIEILKIQGENFWQSISSLLEIPEKILLDKIPDQNLQVKN